MEGVYFGYVGLICILTGFILNISKKMKTDSKSYNVINLIGGSSLTYYSATLKSVPFVILQSIWAIFALYNLVRVCVRKR